MKSSRKISILNYVVKEETDVDVNSVWSTVDKHIVDNPWNIPSGTLMYLRLYAVV